MVQPPLAAVIVLPHKPDRKELTDLATQHLEEFPAEEAYATFEMLEAAPEWLALHEQDQMNAHLRDFGDSGVVLVIYMTEGEYSDEESDD